eukprot:COSAG05_NODE_1661_length_4320_cov_5.356415_2_plen_112_part_00
MYSFRPLPAFLYTDRAITPRRKVDVATPADQGFCCKTAAECGAGMRHNDGMSLFTQFSIDFDSSGTHVDIDGMILTVTTALVLSLLFSHLGVVIITAALLTMVGCPSLYDG